MQRPPFDRRESEILAAQMQQQRDSLDSMRRRMAELHLPAAERRAFVGTPARGGPASRHRRPEMSELRTECCRDIQNYKETIGREAAAFRNSLSSIRSTAEETLANRENARRLKDYLKELEADLVKVQKVKASIESRHSTAAESFTSVSLRVNKLVEALEDKKRKRDEYAAIISRQLSAQEALEAKSIEETVDRKSLDEAISWYNKVLGFRAEGGEGVKFIFKKVDLASPEKEFSFTIKLHENVYSLLHCNPYVNGVEDLVLDLNRTNELFKFVRIMREKFVALTVKGHLPKMISSYEDPSYIHLSSPPPASVDTSTGTTMLCNTVQTPDGVSARRKSGLLQKETEESLSARRRSSRLQAKKSQ